MTTNPGTDNPPVDRPLTAAAATRYQQLRGHLAALRLPTPPNSCPPSSTRPATKDCR